MVEEGIGIIATVNEFVDSDKPTFQLVGDPNDHVIKSYWFKVRCVVCPKEVFQLCLSERNLEENLLNHLHGVVHAKTLEDLNTKSAQGSALSTGKRGRPSRSLASSGKASQKGLHSFFRHVEGELQSYDRESLSLLACWGMRGPNFVYAGKSYGIDGLLFDPHPGQLWYPEPYLEALLKVDGDVVIVKGAFRHRSCTRFSMSGEPFQNFTCSMCSSIVLETDFRLRVVREKHAVEKRGLKDTGRG